MNPIVSIIILNWNGWRDTIECLESLFRISYSTYEVILLDNSSKDNSVQNIKDYLAGRRTDICSDFFEYSPANKPITILEYTNDEAEAGGGRESEIKDLPSSRKIVIIRNDRNYGFAEGNNIGIRYALKAQNPDLILLLNNDTVVKNDFLVKLVEAIAIDENIGFAGPIIYKYDCNGRKDIISVAGINLIMSRGTYLRLGSGEVDRGQYRSIAYVDYLEGSCLLIKRSVLDKIGLLDACYFAYWEEADLCRRGFEAGFKCIMVPTTGIWHKISTTKPHGLILYYMTRNRLWFLKSHATAAEMISFLGYFCFGQFWTILGLYLLRKDWVRVMAFLKGVLHGAMPKRKLDNAEDHSIRIGINKEHQ